MDWGTFDLRDLRHCDAAERVLLLEDLREWVEANADPGVPPAGAPTGEVRVFKKAVDLLALPPDRRDTVVRTLDVWAETIRQAVTDPQAFATEALRSVGVPFPGLAARLLGPRAVCVDSLLERGLIWTDDGEEVVHALRVQLTGERGETLASIERPERRRPGFGPR